MGLEWEGESNMRDSQRKVIGGRARSISGGREGEVRWQKSVVVSKTRDSRRRVGGDMQPQGQWERGDKGK